MGITGKKVRISIKVAGKIASPLFARVRPAKQKGVVRLVISPDDKGRLEKAAIVASCIHQKRPYQWRV